MSHSQIMGKLEEFEPGEDFETYKERLQIYFQINGIDDSKKALILLSLIGKNTYKILKSLVQPKSPSECNYNDLIKALQKYFSPRLNIRAERYKFKKIIQEEGQSIQEFIIRLKEVAQTCDFGDFAKEINTNTTKCFEKMQEHKPLQFKSFALDDALTDQFIAGVRNEEIQRALLNDSSLNFEKCCNVALTMEMSTKESKSIHPVVSTQFAIKTSSSSPQIKNSSESHKSKHSSISGQKLDVQGKISVRVEFQGQTYNLELIVVESSNYFLPLMGRTWLQVLTPHWREKERPHCFGLHSHRAANTLEIDVNDEADEEDMHDDMYEINMLGLVEKQEEVHAVRLHKKTDDTFGRGSIPNIKGVIKLREGATPVYMKPWTIPYAIRSLVVNEIERLERIGVFERVAHSEWGTPIVPVIKADKSVRLCADYKVTLNNCVVNDGHPIPNIDELYQQLKYGEYYCVFEIYQAYLHLNLSDESSMYQIVSTLEGLYRVRKNPLAKIGDKSFEVHQIWDETLPITNEEVAREIKCDKELSSLWLLLQTGASLKDTPYNNMESELMLNERCIYRGIRLIIPLSLRSRVLTELLSAHIGITKIK
ncbi:uncharacterized protein LOC129945700 [Eupeodes corollae]|uniref:uncharacterized protein LOC129945700 n=1 Tax=Eupeodes corollae TaxID=290404 RepID=UPI002493AEFD|nr:uncharacterized protein LOC129945700 [Eupeodes corollae]